MQKAPVFQRQLSLPARYCWSRTSPVRPLGGTFRWSLGWNCCCSSRAEMELSAQVCWASSHITGTHLHSRTDHQSHRDSKVSHPGAGTPASPVSPTRAHLVPEQLRSALAGDKAQAWTPRECQLCCGVSPCGLSKIESLCLGYYSKNVPSALKPVVTAGLMLAKSGIVHTQNYCANISGQEDPVPSITWAERICLLRTKRINLYNYGN